MQDLLTVAATAVEIEIVALPTLRLVSQLMPRRNRVAPGQLELPLFQSAQPESEPDIIDYPGEFAPLPAELKAGDPELDNWVTQPTELPAPAVEPDPWETVEVEPVAITTVAPLHPAVPYLLALPPAKEQAQQRKYSPKELRDLCQQHGIKWRNALGKNRHMPTAEMRQQLAAKGVIAA